MKTLQYVVYECQILKKDSFRYEPNHPSYKGLWREDAFLYFLFDRKVDDFFQSWLSSFYGNKLSVKNIYHLPLKAWQTFEKVTTIGNFMIVTADNTGSTCIHERHPCKVIKLHHSFSFGSGLHSSTQACLQAIEWVLSRKETSIVMDAGTGTGILTFASIFSGASKVIGTDINPISLKEAEANRILNGIDHSISFVLGSGLSFVNPARISLVVMNLEWPSLKEIFESEEWLSFSTIIVGGFTQSLWPKLLKLICSSLYFTENIFWVGKWGALVITQETPKV